MLEKTLESPLDCKVIKPVDPKGNQFWIFIWGTDTEAEAPILLATWCKELTHGKRPWYWERLKAGGEEEDRGWDGWMASLTQWTWVWASSGRWWSTGRPGMLQSMGSQSWTRLSDWAELKAIKSTKSVAELKKQTPGWASRSDVQKLHCRWRSRGACCSRHDQEVISAAAATASAASRTAVTYTAKWMLCVRLSPCGINPVPWPR